MQCRTRGLPVCSESTPAIRRHGHRKCRHRKSSGPFGGAGRPKDDGIWFPVAPLASQLEGHFDSSLSKSSFACCYSTYIYTYILYLYLSISLSIYLYIHLRTHSKEIVCHGPSQAANLLESAAQSAYLYPVSYIYIYMYIYIPYMYIYTPILYLCHYRYI